MGMFFMNVRLNFTVKEMNIFFVENLNNELTLKTKVYFQEETIFK